jgi:GT2 family glycosyltransferase
LHSLLTDLERSGLEAEILVVDNASTDGTPGHVALEFPQVHLIANTENVGFGAGSNIALRRLVQSGPSDHRYVWILNPDTEVLAGATSALLACMTREPGAGLIGPKLIYSDGSPQPSAFRFPGLVQLVFELYRLPMRLYDTPLNGRYPAHLYERGKPFRVDHPLGAAMMVRVETLAQVGLLDEGYHMYCEEIDWAWRMRLAGWQSFCVPGAEVVHHAGRSTAQVPVSSFVNLWTSRARLYAQYHGPVTWTLARAMVRVGIHRRMRDATPSLATACRAVLRSWETAR